MRDDPGYTSARGHLREVTPHRHKEASIRGAQPQLVTDTPSWPNEVVGADLLDGMTDALRSHLVAPLPCLQTMALWALYSHVFDALETSPLLAVVSPQKRCGKTSALTAMSYLVRRPLGVSNITPAALYRAIDKWQPTLLIDEAETFMTSHEELRGIVNSGHKRSMARVVRSVGEKHEPYAFSTWCPKVIARIGALESTLTDRALVISLRRKRPTETVANLGAPAIARLEVLGQQATRWGLDNKERLPAPSCDLPGLNDRAKDNWVVLVQIAAAAGGGWPRIAADAAQYFSHFLDSSNDDDASTILLEDIRAIFQLTDEARLPSQVLAQLLGQMEHRPWPEWRSHRPITPRQIAQLLAPYRIQPKSIRVSELGTPKGYDLSQFEDAFARYLRPSSATPPQENL